MQLNCKSVWKRQTLMSKIMAAMTMHSQNENEQVIMLTQMLF